MHAVNTRKQFYVIFSINEVKRYLLNKRFIAQLAYRHRYQLSQLRYHILYDYVYYFQITK